MNLNPTELTLHGPIKSMLKKSKTCEILMGQSDCDLVVFAHFVQIKHSRI